MANFEMVLKLDPNNTRVTVQPKDRLDGEIISQAVGRANYQGVGYSVSYAGYRLDGQTVNQFLQAAQANLRLWGFEITQEPKIYPTPMASAGNKEVTL